MIKQNQNQQFTHKQQEEIISFFFKFILLEKLTKYICITSYVKYYWPIWYSQLSKLTQQHFNTDWYFLWTKAGQLKSIQKTASPLVCKHWYGCSES